MFDIKHFMNNTASAARLDFYNNYASREESTQQEGSGLTTVSISPASRTEFAIMVGYSLKDLIFSIAMIGPTAIYESCRSLIQGNFPHFKATRIQAHNIFANMLKISFYATGLLFPGTINRKILMMGENGISAEGSPSQEERDALADAGRENHILRPVIGYNEEWTSLDNPQIHVLKFQVVKKN